MDVSETNKRGNPGLNAKGLTVRLTDDERARLTARAGRTPLSTYVREALLDADGREPRRKQQSSVVDEQALGQVLAALGQSRLSSNLNQLARAANVGALLPGPETDAALRAAADDIASIRALLMRALGYSAEGRR